MVNFFESATHVVLTGDWKELEQLSEDMRFRPERYFYNDSYTRFRVTGGKDGWDGWSYPLRVAGNQAKCQRGHRDHLLALCKLHCFEVNTDKLLPRPFANLSVDDVHPDIIKADFVLDEHQRRTVQQWLVHGIGISHTTCGGGKTACFSGAAAMIKQRYPNARIIYVTPSERLVRQACKDLKGFLPDFDISQFGGGKKDETGKDMVICTAAMLNHHFKRLKKEGWLSTFLVLLYDESQHASSETSVKIVEAIPAYFRFGATDSIQDDNKSRQMAMFGLFGPVRNRVDTSTYTSIGRLVRPHIYLVDVKSWANKFADVQQYPAPGSPAFSLVDGIWKKGVYRGPVYAVDSAGEPQIKRVRTLDENQEWIVVEEQVTVPGLHEIEMDGEQMQIESRWVLLDRLYDRSITRFKERNELIVRWAKFYSEQQFPTLLVCTRTLHIYILEALLARAGVPSEMVRILFSQDSSARRDECFEWFKATPGSILISPLVKEGVSLNELKALVVCDHLSGFDVARQIIGRALRKKVDTDKAHVTMFVENQAPSFRQSSKALYRQLEQVEGFKFYHPVQGPETVEWEFDLVKP